MVFLGFLVVFDKSQKKTFVASSSSRLVKIDVSGHLLNGESRKTKLAWGPG